MAALATKAIIFDCIGVLYKDGNALFRGQELNTELVDFIKNALKPRYKIGLLSNIDRGWINVFISKYRLEELFDVVIVSGDEGIAKPEKAIYQRMSDSIGVKPVSCLMVDDLVENCLGAEKTGMQSMHFTTNLQLFEDMIKTGLTLEKD